MRFEGGEDLPSKKSKSPATSPMAPTTASPPSTMPPPSTPKRGS